MKNLHKFVLLEVIFLIAASAFIPVGLFTDSYLSAHRYPDHCLIEGECEYDNGLASFMATWKDTRDNTSILTAIPNVAEKIADSVASGRTTSIVASILTVVIWMVLFNAAYFIGANIGKKMRG